MFKGLHSALQKVKPTENLAKHPDAIPVLSADALLASEKRQHHLKNIKALLNLPPKLYDDLYLKVIRQFAEFTQSLPDTQYGIFAHDGGFLDHGLERASRALSLCLSYFFPQEKTFQSVSPQEALWIYAVFTAALLLDIGKIAVKYDIDICHKDGEVIKNWLAYDGPMAKQGKFYRFSFLKRNLDNLRRLITGLLARQILEQASDENDSKNSGFNWIASNPDVLETWLVILQGERRLPMTSFMSSIPIADAQIIEHYFATKLPTHLTNPIANPNSLFEAHHHNVDDFAPATETAEAFVRWLRDKLASNEIKVNEAKSDVHIVEDGVALDAALFDKFLKERGSSLPRTITAEGLEKQFLQALELSWDSAGNIQKRYAAIQGVSATEHIRRYLIVGRRELLFVPGYQSDLSPYVNKTLQTQVPILPQQPARDQQQQQSLQNQLNNV